jgi:hypothetical protein
MQLHVARLCMDCEELHDMQTCPVCGSESFAFISRWVPAPERRLRPRPPDPSPAVETYRELLSPPSARSSSGVTRWLRRGAVGAAAIAAVGWAWQRNTGTGSPRPKTAGSEETESPAPSSSH